METDKCIFKDDPLYMKSLIGKSVEVTTTYKTYKGALYVIDPNSKTVVLANPHSDPFDNCNLDFILYHSIKSFTVVSDNVVSPSFLFENVTPKDTEDLESKKQKLKRWLEENLIDVQEEGDLLKLGGVLTIEYPYTADQCLCDNTIVLERIRTIINRMPEDCLN